MYSSPNYSLDPAPEWVVASSTEEVALEMERPMTVWRILVEILFYAIIFVLAYGQQTGLTRIPLLGGGIVTLSGLACFFVMFMTGERLTFTLWMCIAIFAGANMSQVFGQSETPIIGKGISQMTFLTGMQAIIYYVCLNKNASRRLLLAIGGVTLALVVTLGRAVGSGRNKRLQVEDVANFLANANTVAYIAGFCCVALLFWSLRSTKTLRPLLWAGAAAMAVITIQTLSRTGIIVMVFGLAMLVFAVLGARGARIGGLIVLVVVVVAGMQLTVMFADSFNLLGERFSGERKNTESRTNLYDLRTISDLISTIPFGRGPDNAQMTSTGIAAHNTFIHNWMAFGAVTGLPVIVWQLVVGLRVLRMLRSGDHPADIRIMIFTFYCMVLAEYLTNNFAFLEFSAMYATALVDKYTIPYSRAAMNRRMMDAVYAEAPYGNDRAFSTYSY